MSDDDITITDPAPSPFAVAEATETVMIALVIELVKSGLMSGRSLADRLTRLSESEKHPLSPAAKERVQAFITTLVGKAPVTFTVHQGGGKPEAED